MKPMLRRWASRPAALRKKAEQLTAHELSARLLRSFPELVYHPGMSGNVDVHYQDREIRGAVCCTPAEAMLMHHAARLAEPANAIEIGSYIGWSSVHLASALKQGLTCVDPFLETGAREDGVDPARVAHARFLANIERAGVKDKVRLVREKSPDALPAAAAGRPWDFAFVDGWHLGGAPLRDVLGVMPFLTDRAALMLHDLWIPDVRDAFLYLVARGWSHHVFDTSNYLTILWRGGDPAWLSELRALGARPEFVLPAARGRRFLFGLGEDSIGTVRGAFATVG